MEANSNSQNTQIKKAKGPIRWGAIIPFFTICAIIGIYMHFFFDHHLKKAIEWAGYKAVGAEVNVADLETSFFNASLVIKGIELTDSEKPTQDSIKIGDIKFSMLWDALLRARIVINEASVNQIEFAVPRKSAGKVKPPEPVSNEPSAAAKEANKLKGEALKQAQEEYNDNALGDIVAILGGADPNAQLKQIEGQLASKQILEKFQADLQTKQAKWNEKLKQLPQGKEVQALGDRLNKVKLKDFKNPQELQQSLQELDAIFKDADSKYKVLQATNDEFNTDLKQTDAQYKEVEAQIKKDIKELENHFHIPKIDAKSLTRSVFAKYLAPYTSKVNHYKELATKYLPPKFLKKGSKTEEDTSIQPHPREKGITYEFGRLNSYPLFWLKHTGISSQAGTSAYSGNIKGDITDISSNQKLTGRPTVLTVQGNFPAQNLSDLLCKLSLDNTQTNSKVSLDLGIGTYLLQGKQLVDSPDVKIGFKQASGSMKLQAHLVALKDFDMQLNNQFTKIDYDISSKNEVADQILKAVFNGIPTIQLTASGSGELPSIALNAESNLGGELQKGFEKQIQAKINEARKKIQAYVDEQIGKQKAQVEAEINKIKTQVNQEVQKVQAQLDTEKKQAEGKVEQAKKDASKQGQKQLEEQGKKALDDLKNKLGW